MRKLGQGATSDVHLAYSPLPDDPDRVVALKCARSELASTANVAEMFAHEARLIAMFHHESVVRLFDHGVDESSRPYLALEYLNGQSLADVLNAAVERDILLPINVVGRIGVAILAGLDHIHTIADLDGESLGIVHCDVSPHNLFVTYGGDVKLVDFGFTQSCQSETAFDVPGRSAYSAPEVVRGESFDARADLFSLGVVLWELLARVRLFKRQTDELTREALLHGHVPGLAARAPSCPDDFEEIVRRALARDPAERFPTARAMRDALLAFLADRSELLEQNAIGSFMTELFGAKGAEIDRVRERAAAKRASQADSEPPTLLRTPPPIELEAVAEQLLVTPRRSLLTPEPPSTVTPAVTETAAPVAEVVPQEPPVVAAAAQVAESSAEPATWMRRLESRSPLGRYTGPAVFVLVLLVVILLVAFTVR